VTRECIVCEGNITPAEPAFALKIMAWTVHQGPQIQVSAPTFYFCRACFFSAKGQVQTIRELLLQKKNGGLACCTG